MFAPSASRLDLAHRCIFPWTGRLRWPRWQPNAAASFGSAVSRVAEALAYDVTPGSPDDRTKPPDISDLGLSDTDQRRLAAITVLLREQLERDDDAERLPERALAYDVATGTARPLKSSGPRDYSDVRAGELSGTPDLERRHGDRWIVRDWKTGRYMQGVRPIESGQLRMLGLAVARLRGVDEIDIELAHVDEDGIRIVTDTMTAFELASAADELRELWARLKGGAAVPTPGRWCSDHYCPIASECPATQRALAAIAGASELRMPLSVELQSPEHAAYVRDRLQAVQTAAKAIEEALKAFASKTPIPLGDGRVWGMRELTRETIDLGVSGATEAMRTRLGPMGFGAAVECKTSKAAIHRVAVAGASKRGEAKALETALLDELRAMGAVRESTYVKFEEWKPKADEAPAAAGGALPVTAADAHTQ